MAQQKLLLKDHHKSGTTIQIPATENVAFSVAVGTFAIGRRSRRNKRHDELCLYVQIVESLFEFSVEIARAASLRRAWVHEEQGGNESGSVESAVGGEIVKTERSVGLVEMVRSVGRRGHSVRGVEEADARQNQTEESAFCDCRDGNAHSFAVSQG